MTCLRCVIEGKGWCGAGAKVVALMGVTCLGVNIGVDVYRIEFQCIGLSSFFDVSEYRFFHVSECRTFYVAECRFFDTSVSNFDMSEYRDSDVSNLFNISEYRTCFATPSSGVPVYVSMSIYHMSKPCRSFFRSRRCRWELDSDVDNRYPINPTQ